jgi:3D (Asp-Asp-Asp) domain-containing protein
VHDKHFFQSMMLKKSCGSDWMRILIFLLLFAGLLFISGCDRNINSLEVTATAYTSSKDETDSTPFEAAWGDRLRPGMKTIAVSRDLIKKGLSRGVEVSIEGLDGKYRVLDKMNEKWTNKIDIYMGTDKKAAKKWGKRVVVIYWDKNQS